MTKEETKNVLKVLERIKDPDANVAAAIAIVNKQLAYFNKQKGQLKQQYEYDSRW
jgi:hypothetical protein